MAVAPETRLPETRCTVDDPRLVELSGLAVVDDGLWAMADGGRRVQLHRIDPDTCAVVESRTATVDPYDAEDLAVGPDGTLWVGDTGDNDQRRGTVALIVVPQRGEPVLHRLTYPDGPHDAEALLVDARGDADDRHQERGCGRDLPARKGHCAAWARSRWCTSPTSRCPPPRRRAARSAGSGAGP